MHGNYIKFFPFNFVFFSPPLMFLLFHSCFTHSPLLLVLHFCLFLFIPTLFALAIVLHFHVHVHFTKGILQNKNNCSQERERFGRLQFIIHLRPFSNSLFLCC